MVTGSNLRICLVSHEQCLSFLHTNSIRMYAISSGSGLTVWMNSTSKRADRWAQRLTLIEITAGIELIEIHRKITVPEICTEKRRHDLVAMWRFVTLMPKRNRGD